MENRYRRAAAGTRRLATKLIVHRCVASPPCGAQVGLSLLFFGCRRPDEDSIYEAELNALVEQGVTELSTAFFRVNPKQKVYIQHRLQEQQERVWALLEQGAVVYICGDASRLEPDVKQTLLAIYQEQTGQAWRLGRVSAAVQKQVLQVLGEMFAK